jgi:allophanate hydrolase subunit 1
VAIAGNQAGIYPMDSPGGWRVLGRLPFAIFEPARPSPVLFSPHDQVIFVSVSASYFNELLTSAKHGELRLDDFKQ